MIKLSNKILFLFILGLSQLTHGQNKLDSLLISVTKNNPSIIAFQNMIKAKCTQAKTGLYPENPHFEYDWMQGTPQNAGNQTDITFIQTFDFPTAYGKKATISSLTIEQLEIEAKAYKQDVLLKTKSLYLEQIYQNKRQAELKKRLRLAEQLVDKFEKNFNEGNTSKLELNKAKLYLLKIQSDNVSCKNEIQANQKLLTQLNGGNDISINDTTYPIVEELPMLDSIFVLARKGDYQLQSLQKEIEKSEQQISLNKALALPKLEAGYRHQAILGQKFNGFHAGINLPLFENKNKVTASKDELVYIQSVEAGHISEHHTEIETVYQSVIALQQMLEKYRNVLQESNTEALITKALNSGELSFLDFHRELRLFASTYDDYLQSEKEYQLKLAQLLKFELIHSVTIN